MAARLLAVLAWLGTLPAAAGPPGEGAQEALQGLNRIRQAAGLDGLAWSGTLAKAARGHARYLAGRFPEGAQRSEQSLHVQLPEAAAFTGEDPSERAVRAGYPHGRVRENVSLGTDDPARSLDGLMTAIYHRMAFLDLEADEAGIAREGKVFVYLLGRSDYSALCRGEMPEAVYEPPALCIDTPVDPGYMETLCASLPSEARFEPPYERACEGGTLLDRDYMQRWCADPPRRAVLDGAGTYYEPCGTDLRVDARWWRRFCADPPAAARYGHDGSYYEICDGRRVHAGWLERHCARLPEEALYAYDGRYLEVCAGDRRMHAQWRDRLDARRHAGLPGIVHWPPDGAADVTPAFYEEQPDPLPDREVSGNPLSAQVNPRDLEDLSLGTLRLQRIADDGARTAVPIRTLGAESDPHGKLAPSEHAFFPLEHLGWGVRYEAELQTDRKGSGGTLRWGFRTRDPGIPVLTARPGSRRLAFPAGEPFLLFIPPTDSAPRPLGRYSYRAPARASVRAEPVDYNSARFRISGAACHPVVVSPDRGPAVELRAQGCGP